MAVAEQFLGVLQLGFKCVRLEGSMTMDHRDRMINSFTNDPTVTVFLMSLKAGGVALNLTAASHVMLMDPWYVSTPRCVPAWCCVGHSS
jgi:SNF2 family DNA or RNA helicase